MTDIKNIWQNLISKLRVKLRECIAPNHHTNLMRAGRNWFRFVPAHCTGEHFAITDGRRFGWW
jgi:hypothetical protein